MDADVLAARFRRSVSAAGKRIAIVDGDRGTRRTSYAALFELSEVVAGRLRRDCIIGPVGVLGEEGFGLEYCACYFGCVLANVDFVLLDSKWSEREMEAIVLSARLTSVVGPGESILGRWAEAPFERISLELTRGPGVFVGLARVPSVGSKTRQAIAGHRSHEGQRIDSAADIIIPTSGTSGIPKLVRHTQISLVSMVEGIQATFKGEFSVSAQSIRKMAKLFRGRSKVALQMAIGRTVWMTPLPLWRIGGHSLMLQALLTQGTLVVPWNQRSSTLLSLCVAEKVNVLAFSPLSGELFVRAMEREAPELDRLLVIGLGSDRVPRGLVERLRRAAGCAVVVGYGSTETGGGVTSTSLLDSEPLPDDCVGRPMTGVQFRIVDDRGVQLPLGSVGQIQCQVTRSKLGHVLRSATDPNVVGDLEPVGGPSSDVWYETGDAGWMDSLGCLFVVGRTDDLIVKAGKKIDPSLVESAIEEVPGVLLSAVVGLESRRGGTRVAAAVVTSENNARIVQEIIDHLRTCLGKDNLPDVVALVESIPTTKDGKIIRSEVRERFDDRGASELDHDEGLIEIEKSKL